MGLFSGGKGSSSQQTAEYEAPDMGAATEAMVGMMGAYMTSMQQMMGASMEQVSAMTANMQTPQMPDLYESPGVDWSAAEAELAAKARADYKLEEQRKHGRSDTILTSPLLDEEDPMTTGSIIAGK